MKSEGRTSIAFTLSGRRYQLSRDDVQSRLAEVAPGAIRKHAVLVNDTWFPVIQAFEVASEIPRSEFMSNTARRHLSALGYEVTGDVDSRAVAGVRPAPSSPEPTSQHLQRPMSLSDEWHTEANVQAALVTALAAERWRILSVANTATKEHGVDVIASLEQQVVGIEVKGFPSRNYADPTRAGEVKRTSPSTQAGHWYAQAVLAAMRLRGTEPTWRSVIALPDFPRYRDLYAQTIGSLDASLIEVWWLDQAGGLHRS